MRFCQAIARVSTEESILLNWESGANPRLSSFNSRLRLLIEKCAPERINGLLRWNHNSMLIIDADDFGRSAAETDVALQCYQRGRLTSVSAMVFMTDSERAAELAKENELEIGLHLNVTERFSGTRVEATLADYHDKIARFLTRNRYAQILYNPYLRT